MNETRVEMSDRHREEWETFRRKALAPILDDPALAEEKHVKSMKYVADTLRIAQDGERRAFEFSSDDPRDDSPLSFSWEDGDASN